MHVTFNETVRRIAAGGWGREFDSQADAEKSLIADGDKLAAMSILEIVRRMNVVIDALAADRTTRENKDAAKPDNAKQFPSISVGEFLYECDSATDGVSRYVVTSKLPDNTVRMVLADAADYRWDRVIWATNESFTSPEEALMKGAANDIDYHARRAEFAKQAMKAIRDNKELSEFMYGISDDE